MRKFLIQLCASIVLTIPVSLGSFAVVWPSYTLRLLQSAESPAGVTLGSVEGNLLVSIPLLGSLVATLAAGYIADTLGRKTMQILCGLLFVVSWSLTTTANSAAQLLTARLIVGLSNGLSVTNAVVFISELTELRVRGGCITLVTLSYHLGALLSYLLGWCCSYTLICYINLTISVGTVLLITSLKESPFYLMKNGLEKEARSALLYYRGVPGAARTTEAIARELADIRKHVHNGLERPISLMETEQLCKDESSPNTVIAGASAPVTSPTMESRNPLILLLSIGYNRRALITLVSMMALCVCEGMIVVQTYAGSIFMEAVPTLSPHLCSVLLAAVLLATSTLTVILTDLFTRRFLMISTTLIVSVCLGVLASQLRWSWGPPWVAPAAILLFSCCFTVGCINIPMVQLGETFAPPVNSAASGIVMFSMFTANFLVLLIYPPLVELLGIDGIFFTFSLVSAFTAFVSFLILKETRRVPIDIIQQMYSAGYLYKKE